MKLSVYSDTNRGGRAHNEDSLLYSCDGERGIFVLADGLGGHDKGEVASHLAAEAICAGGIGCLPDQNELLERFQTANRRILDAQRKPGQEEMRTTAAALVLENGNACWAHIGDSRLYRVADGRIGQVTRDHSVTYMKYLGGEISYMDVCHDDDRSSLLRVLGKPTCAPEGGSGPAEPGDAFLLCSDGFWEFVYNEEMLADCLKAHTPEEWARLMLLRHIRRTPSGNDNFSLITIFVEDEI